MRPPSGKIGPMVRSRRKACRIAPDVRREILQFACRLRQRYSPRFKADAELRTKAGRLLRNLLPPRRRRGRPGDPTTTRAILLHRKLRRKFPEETPRQVWSRVYPLAIPGYDAMAEIEQQSARERLRERIGWRGRKRKRRKIAAKISIS